jgi:hypothetical protein
VKPGAAPSIRPPYPGDGCTHRLGPDMGQAAGDLGWRESETGPGWRGGRLGGDWVTDGRA